MYGTAIPVASPPPQNQGLFGLTGVGLCCLLLLGGLLIAGAIVIGIIPAYLKTTKVHHTNRVFLTEPVYLTVQPNSTASNNGGIPSQNLNALARAIEDSRGLPRGTVTVTQAGFNTPATGRKKRNIFALRRRKRADGQFLYIALQFDQILCTFCSTLDFFQSLAGTTLSNSITTCSGQTSTYELTILNIDLTIPPAFAAILTGSTCTSAVFPVTTTSTQAAVTNSVG